MSPPDSACSPPPKRPFDRIIPLSIAVALFMEALDSTIVSTSLPAIAADLGEPATRLSLLITTYLLAVTVLIPLSGWVADRFGARKVFAAAILLFTFASALAAAANSLTLLVAARALQGVGGALMMPVGRLILLRSVPRERFVEATSYVTVPALIGPTMGPLVGGAVATWLGWKWIFLINVPIGLIGIFVVLRAIPNVTEPPPGRFDARGFTLFGLGLAGFVLACEMVGRGTLDRASEIALLLGSLLLLALYGLHARRAEHPALDLKLFRLPSFRAGVIGGSVCRVGFNGTPFLLPLLFQLGFGMSPIQSGSLTFATALGAMILKIGAPAIVRGFGFRSILIVNAGLIALLMFSFSLFQATTPHLLIVLMLGVFGFVRSLQFTCLNALAYADVSVDRASHATSLTSVGQQLSASLAIALAAGLLSATSRFNGHVTPDRTDFAWTFGLCALVTIASIPWFARLSPDTGDAMRGIPRRRRETRLTGSEAPEAAD